MRKELLELTKGEEAIMELFWNSGRPLTSMDICQMTDDFNTAYIHKLLQSLLKKEVLKIDGRMKCGKQYARQFVPAITKEQYGAFVVKQLGINDEKALANLTVALVSHSDEKSKQGLIKELESIVEQLKKC